MDGDKGNQRFERQIFNWNDEITSTEQQQLRFEEQRDAILKRNDTEPINFSFSNISQQNQAFFTENLQMPQRPSSNYLMMYCGFPFNQNPVRSFSNVEQTLLFQDFFRTKPETQQNININPSSTRESTNRQSFSKSNKNSDEEEKELSSQMKVKKITKQKNPKKTSSNQQPPSRNRNTLTREQKIDKVLNNYTKKALNNVLIKEKIFGGVYNDDLNEAHISHESFISWLKDEKYDKTYGNLQVCKDVWGHKEWDENMGKGHNYKVALTKITRKFLEKNRKAEWKQRYCRIKEYLEIYDKVEEVLLKAMDNDHPTCLSFSGLWKV